MFKIGDEVIGNSKASARYVITVKGWRGRVIGAKSSLIDIEGTRNGGTYRSLEADCFDLIGHKKGMAKKIIKVAYLVVYEIVDEGDPSKEFATLEEAKKFVNGLMLEGTDDNGNDVEQGSVKVYKVEKVAEPTISIEFK